MSDTFLTVAIVAGAIFGVVVILFERFYYKRLLKQLKWRGVLSDVILKQSNKLRKLDLSKEQKNFLNATLRMSHSKYLVWGLLSIDLFAHKRMKERLHEKETMHGLEKDDPLVGEIAFFVFLCTLHASTHNLILESIFRKRFFPDLMKSSKAIKVNVSHKKFAELPELGVICRTVDDKYLKAA